MQEFCVWQKCDERVKCGVHDDVKHCSVTGFPYSVMRMVIHSSFVKTY